MTKCPRCNNEDAVLDSVYGVLPGVSCQESDARFVAKRQPAFYSINRLGRVQRARDLHSGDMLQPFENNKANPDYFKRYPEQVGKFGVVGELSKS